MFAVCKSEKCKINAGMNPATSAGVPKDVRKSALECPDCRHILVWKKDATSDRHFAVRLNSRDKKERMPLPKGISK